MVDFLDLTLVKDIVYMNLALGVSFALYSDTAFFTLQPMYLFELGFSKVKINKILSFFFRGLKTNLKIQIGRCR